MNTATVTIPKKEYEELLETRTRYDFLRSTIPEEDVDDIYAPPPTKDPKVFMEAFRKTGKYNKKFLDGLEKGLSRSSHFHS